MATKYQDYYKMFGLERNATAKDFKPPPEWKHQHFDTESDRGEFTNGKGFSDFFEALFRANTGQQGQSNDFAYGSWNLRGQDHEAKIEISLEEAYSGATKSISLQSYEIDAEGQVTPVTRNYQVKIPKGINDGTRIRMAGKGGPGVSSGPPGDLYLKVNFIPHPRFKAVGHNLNMDVPITPWEAALGSTVIVRLLDGEIHLKIPAGIQSGKKMRIKGKGMWFSILGSGMHATIAGVIVALFIPARGKYDTETFTSKVKEYLNWIVCENECGHSILMNQRHLDAVQAIDIACSNVETPLQRLEHHLQSWVAYLVLPLFALANSGLALRELDMFTAIRHPVTLGVMFGLVFGKPLGILSFTYLCSKLLQAPLLHGINWSHIAGVGLLGGIGFTMSLFISGLSFTSAQVKEKIMKLTKSGMELRIVIEKAIKDHVITNSEYEEIMRVANKDSIVDDHEQRLLSQLQGLLENGTLKRVKG